MATDKYVFFGGGGCTGGNVSRWVGGNEEIFG